MTDFKQRYEIIYKKYLAQYGAGCAKVNETTFAKFLDIPLTSVRNWRERNTVPTAKGVKAIHDKLGFAFAWLIAGEGEMFDNTEALLAEKDAEIARLEGENRRLATQLRHDGVTDEKSLPATGKAAGQE